MPSRNTEAIIRAIEGQPFGDGVTVSGDTTAIIRAILGQPVGLGMSISNDAWALVKAWQGDYSGKLASNNTLAIIRALQGDYGQGGASISNDTLAIIRAIEANAAPPPVLLPQFICDGNSLTVGHPGSDANSYPSQLLALLGGAGAWTKYNFGVNAQTLGDMIADAAAQIDVLFDPARPQNIVVEWGGITNIGPSTGAETYALIADYCSARRAAGFRVVELTLTCSGVLNPTQEGYRQDCNTLIRANCPPADLCDVDANEVIGGVGAGANTDYFVDGLHFTTAGYRIIAGCVKDVISPDTAAPVVASANVPTSGNKVTVNLTDDSTIIPVIGVTGFTVKVNAIAVTVSSATGLDHNITLNLAAVVYPGDTVTLDYAPGNVTDSSAAENALAGFSALAVTNNSTQSAILTMRVAGSGTTADDGDYTKRGTSGGKDYFNKIGQPDNRDLSSIFWASPYWVIVRLDGTLDYYSATDVLSPADAVWSVLLGTGPVPTVTQL